MLHAVNYTKGRTRLVCSRLGGNAPGSSEDGNMTRPEGRGFAPPNFATPLTRIRLSGHASGQRI